MFFFQSAMLLFYNVDGCLYYKKRRIKQKKQGRTEKEKEKRRKQDVLKKQCGRENNHASCSPILLNTYFCLTHTSLIIRNG